MVRGMEAPERRVCRTLAYLLRNTSYVKRLRPEAPGVAWCGEALAFAGELEKPSGEGEASLGRAGDDEDGIVAGNGAEDLLELLLIDGFGDGLGAASYRMKDDELPDPVDAREELRQEIAEQRVVFVGHQRARQHVPTAVLCGN